MKPELNLTFDLICGFGRSASQVAGSVSTKVQLLLMRRRVCASHIFGCRLADVSPEASLRGLRASNKEQAIVAYLGCAPPPLRDAGHRYSLIQRLFYSASYWVVHLTSITCTSNLWFPETHRWRRPMDDQSISFADTLAQLHTESRGKNNLRRIVDINAIFNFSRMWKSASCSTLQIEVIPSIFLNQHTAVKLEIIIMVNERSFKC